MDCPLTSQACQAAGRDLGLPLDRKTTRVSIGALRGADLHAAQRGHRDCFFVFDAPSTQDAALGAARGGRPSVVVEDVSYGNSDREEQQLKGQRKTVLGLAVGVWQFDSERRKHETNH
jgi:hypothetical protein